MPQMLFLLKEFVEINWVLSVRVYNSICENKHEKNSGVTPSVLSECLHIFPCQEKQNDFISCDTFLAFFFCIFTMRIMRTCLYPHHHSLSDALRLMCFIFINPEMSVPSIAVYSMNFKQFFLIKNSTKKSLVITKTFLNTVNKIKCWCNTRKNSLLYSILYVLSEIEKKKKQKVLLSRLLVFYWECSVWAF